jgi:hypothetical protein
MFCYHAQITSIGLDEYIYWTGNWYKQGVSETGGHILDACSVDQNKDEHP